MEKGGEIFKNFQSRSPTIWWQEYLQPIGHAMTVTLVVDGCLIKK